MTKIYQTAIFLLLFAVTFVTGCRHASYSPKLEAIDRLIADDPSLALAKLSKISPDSLSEADRNLHSLLTIKAADKTCHMQVSDSVITHVLKYFDSRSEDPYYPMAQYYAGRIYSQIGDYHLALTYFHKALDKLPEDTHDRHLRGDVLSQIAFHLNSLRLYDQALGYLEKVIELEEEMHDTVNLALDLRLSGAILLRSGQYDRAENVLERARAVALNVSDELTATIDNYRAAVKSKKQVNDSALSIIRGVPERIKDVNRYVALSNAAQIYIDCGIPDTAYRYARELIRAENSKNVHNGYSIILSTELKDRIPKDSLATFYEKYGEFVQDFVNRNTPDAALMQVSLYNYTIKERERDKAREAKDRLATVAIVILSVCVIALLILLTINRRSRKQIIKLHEDIDALQALYNRIKEKSESIKENHEDKSRSQETSEETSAGQDDAEETSDKTAADNNVSKSHKRRGKIKAPFIMSEEENKLRQQLRDIYLKIEVKARQLPDLSMTIKNSEVYNEITDHLLKGDVIAHDSDIWTRLANIINKENPDFKRNLELLTGDNLSSANYRLAMLIKCRFKPSEIAKLSGREKSSISTRRAVLRKKLFDEDLGPEVFDRIIQLL